MRHLVRTPMQEILEAEMTDAIGAEPGERTEARLGYRAGHYPRTLKWAADLPRPACL
jgi:putative transposase